MLIYFVSTLRTVWLAVVTIVLQSENYDYMHEKIIIIKYQ